MRKYFYIGKRLALELNGAQTRSILYGMECVLSELDRNTLSTSTLLLAANRENSVLKANITRSYSAYGFDDLTSRESLIGFNGEARDGVVGCDLLGRGRRAYSPVLMRFLSPDIMSPFDKGGLNAYMYCEGDPINYSDPSAMGKHSIIPKSEKPVPRVKTVSSSSRSTAKGGSSSGGTSSKSGASSNVEHEKVGPANPLDPVEASGQAVTPLSPEASLVQKASNLLESYLSDQGANEKSTLSKREMIGGLAMELAKDMGVKGSLYDVAIALNPGLSGRNLGTKVDQLRRFVQKVPKQ
ncbi:RHS repeat-associated core domain-containing protein [Pseudomonas sp. NPDC012596]|uniref:RHS repeat-associated core domain-containing protein n=1 Tax=Pseudomonas sp. NPDC012596 TaxID=3364419 RepID=UPI0036BA781E